ncbi:ABC transporter permease [Rugosimonospora acidiphila]|uniref:Transport permease protein n=1 Tax=Rugosimonospora acidiphila TaxID=556531 RepID=A0ABP9S467_9ACTN
MSVTTAPAPATAKASALRRMVLTEFKLYLRERIGPVWGVGFPLLLLVIFGSIPSFRRPSADLGGLTELDVYVPVLVAFVVTMLSLVSLPIVLAGYRERGILRRLRTTPVGPGRVLIAQLCVSLGTVVVTVAVLLAVARLGYGVALPKQFGGFVVATLLAVAALMAVGLFVAALAPTGKAAQAIGTLLFFPMMFFAGLWLPIAQMPRVLQHISHAAPLGAAVQALQDSAQGHWPHPLQLGTMAAYAVVFGLAAAKLFRWE